jgi:hypothetical protein
MGGPAGGSELLQNTAAQRGGLHGGIKGMIQEKTQSVHNTHLTHLSLKRCCVDTLPEPMDVPFLPPTRLQRQNDPAR